MLSQIITTKCENIAKKSDISRKLYENIHQWLIYNYGNAYCCENNSAHNYSAKRFEWAIIRGKYSRNIEDYKQLCPSCHRKMDKGNFCKNGHEFTQENTYIRKEGWRVCIECRKKRCRYYWRKKHWTN